MTTESLTAIILVLTVQAVAPPSSPAKSGADSSGNSTQAQGRNQDSFDYASEHLKDIDSRSLVISPKYFRAIRAVEAYRRSHQEKLLTPSERELMNFDIHVLGEELVAKETWLTPEQRRTCFVIWLVARPQPGERVYLDTHARAGRTAFYAVRKADFSVIKATLVKQEN